MSYGAFRPEAPTFYARTSYLVVERRPPAVKALAAKGNPKIDSTHSWLNRKARRTAATLFGCPTKKLHAVNEPRNLPAGLVVRTP